MGKPEWVCRRTATYEQGQSLYGEDVLQRRSQEAAEQEGLGHSRLEREHKGFS